MVLFLGVWLYFGPSTDEAIFLSQWVASIPDRPTGLLQKIVDFLVASVPSECSIVFLSVILPAWTLILIGQNLRPRDNTGSKLTLCVILLLSCTQWMESVSQLHPSHGITILCLILLQSGDSVLSDSSERYTQTYRRLTLPLLVIIGLLSWLYHHALGLMLTMLVLVLTIATIRSRLHKGEAPITKYLAGCNLGVLFFSTLTSILRTNEALAGSWLQHTTIVRLTSEPISMLYLLGIGSSLVVLGRGSKHTASSFLPLASQSLLFVSLLISLLVDHESIIARHLALAVAPLLALHISLLLSTITRRDILLSTMFLGYLLIWYWTSQNWTLVSIVSLALLGSLFFALQKTVFHRTRIAFFIVAIGILSYSYLTAGMIAQYFHTKKEMLSLSHRLSKEDALVVPKVQYPIFDLWRTQHKGRYKLLPTHIASSHLDIIDVEPKLSRWMYTKLPAQVRSEGHVSDQSQTFEIANNIPAPTPSKLKDGSLYMHRPDSKNLVFPKNTVTYKNSFDRLEPQWSFHFDRILSDTFLSAPYSHVLGRFSPSIKLPVAEHTLYATDTSHHHPLLIVVQFAAYGPPPLILPKLVVTVERDGRQIFWKGVQIKEQHKNNQVDWNSYVGSTQIAYAPMMAQDSVMIYLWQDGTPTRKWPIEDLEINLSSYREYQLGK